MTTKDITWTTISIIIALGLIILCMWGCPLYKVYKQSKDGEARLRESEYSRQILIQEANAKYQSSSLLAQADTVRAHGIARSNEIIGQSLKDNESYLHWLWIDQLKESKDQIIYIPSTNLGMPILEAGRFGKKSAAPVVTNEEPVNE